MPSLELYHTCRAKGRDSERCERVLLKRYLPELCEERVSEDEGPCRALPLMGIVSKEVAF